MKSAKLFFITVCTVVLVSGCATSDKKGQEDTQKKLTPTEYLEKLKPNLVNITPNDKALKFAESHADNFYKAVKDNDYKAFSKSKKLSRENFNNWRKAVMQTYGELESKSYVGVKANPYILRYMWKWNFKKKSMGTTLDRQVLYNVFIIKYKNKDNYDLFFVGPQ